MYGKTKRVVVLGFLPQTLERLKGEGANADEVERLIAARTADKRFEVEVRHIGSADAPTLYSEILSREDAARHAARTRARKALLADGEPVSSDAISSEMARDPVWSRALGVAVREWIVNGLVSGEAEHARLWELGERAYGAGGGAMLLLEASVQVRQYQTLSDDEGKS